jgi:hypothetical protein
MSDTKPYPLWAVKQRGYDWSPKFFTDPKPARRTAKCVFIQGRYGEQRYNLKNHRVWTFDTKEEAQDFTRNGNKFTEMQTHDRLVQIAEEQAERSKKINEAWVEMYPPIKV